jgi:hypothetical protein
MKLSLPPKIGGKTSLGPSENTVYVAAVEALRQKEREDETQFTTKIGGKTSLGPSENTVYVAAVEALRKKEREDETQFTTKNWWEN